MTEYSFFIGIIYSIETIIDYLSIRSATTSSDDENVGCIVRKTVKKPVSISSIGSLAGAKCSINFTRVPALIVRRFCVSHSKCETNSSLNGSLFVVW